MSAYIVYKPAKNNTEVLYSVYSELDKAVNAAKRIQQEYKNKGWDSWAERVKIRKPSDKTTARKLANELVHKGNDLDMMSQGGTFRGDGKVIAAMKMDELYECASILRKAFPD
jgi:hypothetical protein